MYKMWKMDWKLLEIEITRSSWNDGDVGLNSRLPCGYFVAHLVDDTGRWADESDAAIDAGLCEIWPFRQETVAGMDGVDAVLFADSDDFGDGKIGLNWGQTLANQVGFISLLPVHFHLVLF